MLQVDVDVREQLEVMFNRVMYRECKKREKVEFALCEGSSSNFQNLGAVTE